MNKKYRRDKSINDTGNDFHEPFHRDLIALPRLVPDLYLAFPRFVPRPLMRPYFKPLSRKAEREGKWYTYGNAYLGGVAPSQRGGRVRAAQHCPVSA